MAFSSDESFTWEKVTHGSDDSDNSANTDTEYPKMNGEADEIKVKHEKITFNSHDMDTLPKESKVKKRKHTYEENGIDEMDSPKKKKIKIEPESDVDVKKKKRTSMSSINNSNESDEIYNDEYLDMRVKQEQENRETSIDVKPKKSKKQRVDSFTATESFQENGDEINIPKKEKKSKKKKKRSSNDPGSDIDLQNTEIIDNCVDNVEYTDEPSKKSHKKKKSKEKRKSKTLDSSDFEDKLKLKDTEFQESENQTNTTNISEHNNDYELQNNDSYAEDSISKNHIKSHGHQTSEDLLHKSISDETLVSLKNKAIKPVVQSTPNNMAMPTKNIAGRILDRIRFEDDPDSDIDKTLDSNECNNTSAYLKKYLNQNENLQVVSKSLDRGSEITSNDDIWILKCPHDIDIQKLHNTELSLDSKSKIKMNGETYCGNLDENETKITVMTSNENGFIIKKVTSNGTIHFRKRLPKQHVQDYNVMVNNQTDFIPLPETKCRHPLFGSNYKDAIEVPVRARRCSEAIVADEEETGIQAKKKKNKHNKDHSLIPKLEMDTTDMSFEKSPKREVESDVPVKKAKKRKHAIEEENYKKKSKKIKLEPDSVEAWESEKAIEENLFNF